MIDSHSLHMAAQEKILARFGVTIKDPKNRLTQEEELRFFGMKFIDICGFLVKKYKIEDRVSKEQMNEEFSRLLLTTYEQNIQMMPGLIELIQACRSRGYILAIASSSKKVKIDIVLRKFRLKEMFSAVVSGEDENLPGKPAPDMFLKASGKIGIDPSACLVLEDAKNGVLAAKAAGMYCIGVHNKYTLKRVGVKQDLSKADVQMESLLEVQDMFENI